MRFRPGGFEKERELTVEFRRWKRRFIEDTASRVGFTAAWHTPFISPEGLQLRTSRSRDRLCSCGDAR